MEATGGGEGRDSREKREVAAGTRGGYRQKEIKIGTQSGCAKNRRRVSKCGDTAAASWAPVHPHSREHLRTVLYLRRSSFSLKTFRMKLENGLPSPNGSNPADDTALEFVVATEDDFEEILAMSEGIYGGLDYLPSRYHSWINEANRTVILAKKEGEVIALQSMFIVDGGATVLVEGLRVAPWERGKGVAGVLQKFCSELVREKYPSVKVTRLTRDDKLGPKDFKKYRVITKQGILLVKFNAGELAARLGDVFAKMKESGFPPRPSLLLDKSEVPGVVLARSFLAEVLPNQTIIQDWQPFQPMQSNLALLQKKDLHWMVDNKRRPKVATLCTFPFRVPVGEDWFYLNIDVFGTELGHIRSQLVAHLENHTPTLKGNVMCQLFLDPSLWVPMAEFCTSVLNVELAKDYTEQYLLESDI
ncbi:probable N-acetyltransferase 16 [Pleurodeles waltl]